MKAKFIASATIVGMLFVGGIFAPGSPAIAADRDCSTYGPFFDSVLASASDALDRIAADDGARTYSAFRYALDGMAAMAYGTRDEKYVEQALTWAEAHIKSASIRDHKGYRNWSGPWWSPYASEPIAVHLKDIGISTALSEVARVVLLDPVWARTYGARAKAIRDFVAEHIVEKLLEARFQRYWYESRSLSRTLGLSDKSPQLLRTIVNLSEIGAAIELSWARKIAANWDVYHFQPWRTDALIWDLRRGSEVPGYSWDTSHAFPVPYYYVRAVEAGLESPAILKQLSTLLLETIWNRSSTNPMFTNFVDGVNDSALGREPWGLGVVYHGWVTLGAYDREVQAVMESVLKALIRGQRNPSLDAMNSVYGKLELAGHITRNMRIAGACD
jgi:hypothetical protein